MGSFKRNRFATILALVVVMLASFPIFASEADLKIPEFTGGYRILLLIGILISILGMLFGLYEFISVKKLKAHKSMLEMGEIIFNTCKTYLIQQGKFLIILEIFIALCIAFYFGYLQQMTAGGVATILGWSVIGILGSYGVAWFGIRMNTYANARTAYASLERKPIRILEIPLQSGISIGLLLVSVELIMMLIILLFIPREWAGACFIGFAIGESLGASALRVAGGIFTKIADIGSDNAETIAHCGR
jgi:K(+)-stimulated pyrophosphate-energized sodium pump